MDGSGGGGGGDEPPSNVIHGLGMGAGLEGISTDGAMREAIGRIMGDVADPHFQRTVEETLQEMATGAGASTAGGADAADPQADGHVAASVFSALAQHSGAAGANAVAQTLSMLSRLGDDVGGKDGVAAAGALPGSDAAQSTEALSDELIKKMTAEFEAMGGKDDFEAVTDNMMRQLLSKDIMCAAFSIARSPAAPTPALHPPSIAPSPPPPPRPRADRYTPMHSITERFPGWLATHADGLNREEYANYGKMYQTFQKLVMTYETDPDNFPRVLELMQDLQECGNPPVDIIKDLAPGLELSADGMPVMMPGMGPGMQAPGGGAPMPGVACSVV